VIVFIGFSFIKNLRRVFIYQESQAVDFSDPIILGLRELLIMRSNLLVFIGISAVPIRLFRLSKSAMEKNVEASYFVDVYCRYSDAIYE